MKAKHKTVEGFHVEHRESDPMGGLCWMSGCGCLFWSSVVALFAWMA